MSLFRDPRRPDERPIALRRQLRPAPSHGGPSATVSTVSHTEPGRQPTLPSQRVGSPLRPMPPPARRLSVHGCKPVRQKAMPELGLCSGCMEALRSCLRGYENKLRQKAAAQKGTT